jgi:hypothetical protein
MSASRRHLNLLDKLLFQLDAPGTATARDSSSASRLLIGFRESYSRPHQAGTITPTAASRASRGSASSKPSMTLGEQRRKALGSTNSGDAPDTHMKPWISAYAAYAAEDDDKIHPTCVEENNTRRC